MNAHATPTPAHLLDPTGATPVMQQFFEMKARQPDALIFFRMGDFYELFFDDAYKAAAALGISQTFRGNHNGQPIPMAGVPQHAAEAYLSKLIRMGFKVAVCEQMEDPAEAKKRGSKSVVRRDIVRVVTPGTLTEDGLLDARGANRLAAVAMRAGQAAVASVELSTGEVEVFAVAKEAVAAILAALAPSETLVADRLLSDDTLSQTLKICGGLVQPMPSALSEPQASEARVKRLYGVDTLDGFGGLSPAEIGALGLIAAHLEMTQAGKLPALRAPRRAAEADVMAIDPATRGSLEIDRTQTGDRDGSLLAVIDRTVTSGGARMLASRLARPLLDVAAIDQRLDAVEWFVEHRQLRQRLREVLKGSGDMARALSRLALGRGGPRDLGCLRDTLKVGERLAGMAGDAPDPLSPPPFELEHAFKALTPSLHEGLSQFLNVLEQGLGPDLPALARDGGFVAAGIRPELDQARGLRDDSRKVIIALESQLGRERRAAEDPPQRRAGLFRRGHGRQGRSAVPAAAERHLHPPPDPGQPGALHHGGAGRPGRPHRPGRRAGPGHGGRRLRGLARTGPHPRRRHPDRRRGPGPPRRRRRPGRVGRGRRRRATRSSTSPTPSTPRAPATRWSRPPSSGPAIPIPPTTAAWTPRARPGRLSIVTGPNMAGKSTFLRQNALLAILAQSGCYVPAASFRLGVVDRLFSRVGAGDDLARGRSTFMMEMVETAAILTQAGPRSLVILDEIGRGTATYDGLAIAWACAEALHDTNKSRALFATHYHELATLEERLSARLQPVPAGQGMERRPRVPARGRAGSGRSLVRRAGGQAGRRAEPRRGPRPRGAGPPGEQGPVAGQAGRPAAVRGESGRSAPNLHGGARQSGAERRRGLR
jgi:DNA mismatch repair protein MutS